jgi:hypothetical protein
MKKLQSQLSAYNPQSVPGGFRITLENFTISIGYFNKENETFQLLTREMVDGDEESSTQEDLTESQVLEFVQSLKPVTPVVETIDRSELV